MTCRKVGIWDFNLAIQVNSWITNFLLLNDFLVINQFLLAKQMLTRRLFTSARWNRCRTYSSIPLDYWCIDGTLSFSAHLVDIWKYLFSFLLCYTSLVKLEVCAWFCFNQEINGSRSSCVTSLCAKVSWPGEFWVWNCYIHPSCDFHPTFLSVIHSHLWFLFSISDSLERDIN